MTRILIADDSPQVRHGLRSLLSNHPDWEVCGEAIDGQDALNKTKELAPDVVVLDFAMPIANGVKVAREISRNFPNISVLLCSMYLDSQLASVARRSGILGLVSKSNAGQIVSGIEAVLRGERFIASRI
jgi:DNA-binding NarL/FixJ family response regulator